MLVVSLTVLAFGLTAGRLDGTPITMPMLFTGAGLLLGPSVLGLVDLGVDSGFVAGLAEAALVVVLFTDASRLDLRRVAREHQLAQRLLLLGLPLAILIGTGVGLVLAVPVVAVALTAAVLAPTDAALGQAFVTAKDLPARIRQTLNVESGLNDGLAVPFVLILVDLAREDAGSPLGYLGLLVALVGLGVAAGALVGYLGGRLLLVSADRAWATEATQRIATVSVAGIAYGGAELVGGNGFVATFVAGLVVGTTARELLPSVTVFAEAEGQLLTLATFLLFGAVVAPAAFDLLSWQVVLYAALSLLVVRPVAVALALLGTGVAWRTTLFLGWAGPRGLASIVYLVLVADAGAFEGQDTVVAVGSVTVLLSVVLHGVSAAPLSRAYGRHVHDVMSADDPERVDVPELPVRLARRNPGRGSSGPGPDGQVPPTSSAGTSGSG